MSSNQQKPVRIVQLHAHQILDSRGYPTLAVELTLEDGQRVTAAAPAGASTGQHEARELRDGGTAFGGKGVRRALAGLREEVGPLLTSREWATIGELDAALTDLDGTPGYARLGANTVVAASIAAARALASADGTDLVTWVAAQVGSTPRLPVPHFNVVNGGAHASNGLAFQEFMIAPVGASIEQQAVDAGAEVYHALGSLLRQQYGSVGIGDEGGYAPPLDDERQVLDTLLDAVGQSGFATDGSFFQIALDPAANGFFHDGRYLLRERSLSPEQLVAHYQALVEAYPIRSIEDGLAEDDPAGWQAITERLGGRIQIVGDDLFVTQADRIRQGHRSGYANAALIKPNQVGTVTGTFGAIRAAYDAGMTCMVSHRSGETLDTFIADLAVGAGTGQIKAGAPARGERVAKYNRLTRIEQDTGLPYGLP